MGLPYIIVIPVLRNPIPILGCYIVMIDKIKIANGARATSVITVEKDGKEIVKILNARYANGLFGQGSPTNKLIYLKGVKQILGV